MQSYINPDQYNKDKDKTMPPQSAMVPVNSPSNDPNAQAPSQGWLQQQQALQQQAQANAQQQAAPNPTPTGTIIPGQQVTSNMPTAQQQSQDNQVNGWTPPPGYLQGSTNQQLQNSLGTNPANMSGVGQRGYAEGVLAAHKMRNDDQAQGNANEMQTFKRQEITKQQQISMGMQQAAAKSGYGGVVDYLNTADPERSIQIQQAKTQLDQSMMKSESMATMNNLEKKQAVFAGYGLLGKMGATILAAPPAERQALYTQMLPMVKVVNPDAPDNVEAAQPMFMLGAGQSMPDSAHWAAKQDVLTAQTDVLKAQNDLSRYYANGGKPDDPVAQSLKAKVNQPTMDAAVAQNKVDNISTQNIAAKAGANKQQAEVIGNLTKTYFANPVVKNYNDFDKGYQNFLAAQQLLQKHPEDADAIRQMQAAIVTINGIKRINPNIMSYMTQTDNKAQEELDNLSSTINPHGKVVMSPQAVGRMASLLQGTHDQLAQHIAPITQLYQSQADQFNIPGSSINISSQIPWVNTGGIQQTAVVPTPDQINARAQQDIAAGKDPRQVEMNRQNALNHYGYH